MKLVALIGLAILLPGAGDAVREEVTPVLRCQAATNVALQTAADADLDRAEEECSR